MQQRARAAPCPIRPKCPNSKRPIWIRDALHGHSASSRRQAGINVFQVAELSANSCRCAGQIHSAYRRGSQGLLPESSITDRRRLESAICALHVSGGDPAAAADYPCRWSVRASGTADPVRPPSCGGAQAQCLPRTPPRRVVVFAPSRQACARIRMRRSTAQARTDDLRQRHHHRRRLPQHLARGDHGDSADRLFRALHSIRSWIPIDERTKRGLPTERSGRACTRRRALADDRPARARPRGSARRERQPNHAERDLARRRQMVVAHRGHRRRCCSSPWVALISSRSIRR